MQLSKSFRTWADRVFASSLPNNKKNQNSKKGRVSTGAGQVPRILPVQANSVIHRKQRYVHDGTTSVTPLTWDLTSWALCYADCTVGVAGVNATVYNHYSAVRIKRIQMWFKPPLPEIGTSRPPGGWEINLQYLIAVSSSYTTVSKQISALAMSPEDTAYLSIRPDPEYKLYYPLAYNDLTTPCKFTTYPGTVIDIEFEGIIADGATASLTTATTGVLGYVGKCCLDLNNGAGARVITPTACTYSFD